MSRLREITIKGITYPSIRSAARKYNVEPITIIQRMSRGYTPEQAVGIEPAVKKNSCPIIIKGVIYPSISQAAKAYNMTFEMLTARLKKGYTPDQAVEISRYTGRTITIKGITYPSIADAAKALNMSARFLNDRLKRGYTLDEAINKKDRRCRSITIDGVLYMSIREATKKLGLPEYTLRYKLKKGIYK